MTKKKNVNGYTKSIKKAFENYRWWDYGYMLDFEKAIWKDWLDKYTKRELTHALDEYSNRRANIAKLALKLLLIFEYPYQKKVNINISNASRFINYEFNPLSSIHLWHLREQKAWHLYNLLREYKLQEMWD